jgi:curved DNA-binding protein CbpA
MSSSPLPDHWKALGLDRTADAATIKSTYRKLVLKCHPDKVTDETLKAQKQDEFHKIQQAYETLSDEDRKRTYEAELKLEALRQEKLARTGGADPKTTRFDVRTSSGQRFNTEERRPRSYEADRKPSRATYEDDRYHDTRKYETYDAYPKPSTSSRSTREKESKSTRSTNDRTRSDRNKTRDREERSNRRFVGPDSDGSSTDDKSHHEERVRRREREEERRRDDERRKEEDRRREDARRREDERRRDEERRRDDERRKADDRERRHAEEPRKTSVQPKDKETMEEAIRYIQSKSMRASSRDYEGSRVRREVRPEAPRRSSARPSRGGPEVVSWSSSDPPPFKHSSSSPADLHIPIRSMPQRSFTDTSRDHRRADTSPPPTLSRSSTMPSIPNTSARRTTRVYRDDVIPEHASPDRDYPSVPTPSSTKTYYYTADPSMPGVVPVSFRPDDVQPRHVVREPTRHHRSPSPIKTRPPIGVNRPVSGSTTSASYAVPKGRSSRNVSPVRGGEERGRSSRPLYGERQMSFEPHEIQYAKQYSKDDVRYAPRSRETDDYPRSKPGISRTATYVY